MLPFKVLIDAPFASITTTKLLHPIDHKRVLSLANGYEDGKWQYTTFQRFIWDNIAETALSAKERNALVNEPHSLLAEAAKKLRLTDASGDIGKGSELAEILLYGIMRHHYKALPVAAKIYYKQSERDNAKGADSAHIVLDGKGGFTIWFGESKFYNNIEDARLSDIIESVENLLDTARLKKENSIITSLTDLELLVEDKSIREQIQRVLSTRESIDELKPILHIPILLLHECPVTKSSVAINDSYIQQVTEYHKTRAEAYFKKQIKKLGSKVHKYQDISFHIILFPVPSKEPIIKKFISTAEHYTTA